MEWARVLGPSFAAPLMLWILLREVMKGHREDSAKDRERADKNVAEERTRADARADKNAERHAGEVKALHDLLKEAKCNFDGPCEHKCEAKEILQELRKKEPPPRRGG